MALDDLILLEPDPTHGNPFQLEASSGEWRWAVELADPSAGDYAEWFDLTVFYAGDGYQRGADQYMGRCRAAVSQVQLQIDNVQAEDLGVSVDILAPWGQDTTVLFGVDVTLDAGLLMRFVVFRVVSAETVEWRPVWTGRVETWGDAADAVGQIRRHVVTVTDTSADLVNVPTVTIGDHDEWDTWFTEVLTEADWLYGVDMYGDFADSGMPFDDVPRAAISRLDDGSDPLGLVWRTLRSGRLVIHPAPWDTTNTARYDNPLLDVYPTGVIFSYSPDFTELDYIADDDQQPFGVTRTSLGVINSIIATLPGDLGPEIYPIDNPVSIDKYGTKPVSFTWIVHNEPAVDDLLAAREFASVQALPLRTTIDHEGFFPAMVMLDHLDPITVEHVSHESGNVVTVVGTVRNITERRTFRHESGLSWESTVQIDVTAISVAEALLPVEDLFAVGVTPPLGGPASAEATWTNPTQPDVTPTEVEYRVLGKSLIWNPATYTGVGASGISLNWLAAATTYTLQVRLVRRVDGVTTHASPIREFEFTTPAHIVPFPVPDGEDTDGEFPAIDPECELEVELQESTDGVSWSTIDTFTGSELTDNGDGTYSLTTPVDNSVFDDDKIYRFRSREVCEGVPGDWINGPEFDPPDDWEDPCVTPPAVVDPPFDTDCIVFVPAICAPDIIKEYFSGIEGVKGDAFAGFVAGFDDPETRALRAIADPEWSDAPGGIIAYGECPQITGVTGDKSIAWRGNIADDTVGCVLGDCAAMQIKSVPVMGGDIRFSVVVFMPGATITLPSTNTFPTGDHEVTASFELATGDIILYVDGVEEGTATGTDGAGTINALPIWRVGAPPESWVLDFAVWDAVIVPEAPAITDPMDIADCTHWWDASTLAGADGSAVSTIDNLAALGGVGDLQRRSATNSPNLQTAELNGLNVVALGTSNGFNTPGNVYLANGATVFIVCKVPTMSANGVIIAEGDPTDANCLNFIIHPNSAGQWLSQIRDHALASPLTDTETTFELDLNAWQYLTYRDTGTAVDRRMNGAAEPGGAVSYTRNATPSAGHLDVFTIGYRQNGGTADRFLPTTSYMAECIIYDRPLTDDEIGLVEDYLAAKWGL